MTLFWRVMRCVNVADKMCDAATGTTTATTTTTATVILVITVDLLKGTLQKTLVPVDAPKQLILQIKEI